MTEVLRSCLVSLNQDLLFVINSLAAIHSLPSMVQLVSVNSQRTPLAAAGHSTAFRISFRHLDVWLPLWFIPANWYVTGLTQLTAVPVAKDTSGGCYQNES